MAYERLEKLFKAKEDFDRVKSLDPTNLQASKGLSRILPQINPKDLEKLNQRIEEKRKEKEAEME